MSFDGDALECPSAQYVDLAADDAQGWLVCPGPGAAHLGLEPASIILSSSFINPASSVRPIKRLGAEASTL